MTGALLLSATLIAAAGPIDDPAPKDFPAFLEECYQLAIKQTDQTVEKWGLNDYTYDFDLDKGTITYTGKKGGMKTLTGEVQVVGIFIDADNAWVWPWTQKDLTKAGVADSLRLKAYGKKNGLEPLTTGRLDADRKFGTRMAALDMKLLGGDLLFVHVGESKNRNYMLVRNIKPAD